MNHSEIDSALAEIEQQMADDPQAGVAGTGFWKIVSTVKSDSELTEAFADRIAAIDQEAFTRWAMITMPLGIGTLVAVIGNGFGLALVAAAYSAEEPANGVFMLIGMFVLFTAVHSLAHLAVGRALGIQFTHWFVGTIGRPQPGVKIDYSSYLRTDPMRRAWMHAAGAVASKLIPFLLIPAALAADVPTWTVLAMIGFGLLTITTDALLSVKTGDWKKFLRERAYAQQD